MLPPAYRSRKQDRSHAMNDTPAGAAGSNVPQQMTVNAQYMKDFSFESPSAPRIFGEQPNAEPRVEVNVNVTSQPLAENVYEVALRLKTESKIGDKTAFICDLTYACIATMPAMAEPQLRAALMVECPRLLFPFARAIIADAVREGGFPPLMLAPVDFAGMLRQNEAQARSAANA
ncbi:MAG: protein-export chaperone SecB [Alphaproteobacteria bacterium]|nr:protein-export chaperone SecB [Alphaproteobacteria bacterium]